MPRGQEEVSVSLITHYIRKVSIHRLAMMLILPVEFLQVPWGIRKAGNLEVIQKDMTLNWNLSNSSVNFDCLFPVQQYT